MTNEQTHIDGAGPEAREPLHASAAEPGVDARAAAGPPSGKRDAEALRPDRKVSLTPNVEAARLHTRMLTGEDDPVLPLQVVPDHGKERKNLARAYHGRLSALLPDLAAAQEQGCGVFVAVNATDGRGRRKQNITAYRALFLDLDGAPLPERWPAEPDLIIQSSNGATAKYQVWWAIEPTADAAAWIAMQKALAARFGGDLKCTLTTQVGRLAGFWHQKDPARPWQVRILDDNSAQLQLGRPTLEELADAFGVDLAAEARQETQHEEMPLSAPLHGWDNAIDIRRARQFAADEANWRLTSNNEVSIFDMASDLRRLGISPELSEELILHHLPIGLPASWGDNHIADKVRNAGRYAKESPGEYSAADMLEEFARAPLDPELEEELRAEAEVDRALLAEDAEERIGMRAAMFKRWTVDELLALPPPTWLAEEMIIDRGLVVLYGEPKAYKTFIALDLALCVAMGLPFHGLEIQQGVVTYIAAEGHARELGDRVLAWCQEREVDLSDLKGRFSVVISGVQLDEPDSVAAFIREDPGPCDLLVADTLNRNMAGHESDTQDMSRVVKGCDLLRRKLKTAVLLVHHTGVDGSRERGSTVLRGAVDARLRVTRNRKASGSDLLVEDSRSGPSGRRLQLVPANVLLDPLTMRGTLVMRDHAEEEDARPASVELEPHEQLLVDIYDERPKAQTDLVSKVKSGRSQASVSSKVRRLVKEGFVVPGTVQLTPEGEEEADLLKEMLNDG